LQKKAGKSRRSSAAAGKEPRSGEPSTAAGEVIPPSPPPKGDGASFEEAFELVERSVELLEQGNLPLQESLRQYERGLRALKSCYQILGGAQKRIEVLSEEVGVVAGGAWQPVGSDARLTEVAEAIDRENELPEA